MKTEIEYQLQACRNLAAEFTARGDREAVAYFAARIRQLEKQNGGAR